MAFVFYLKDFNSNILVMIQSLGGNTLPQAFDLAISTENNLIDEGKLSPQPLMHVFPNLSNQPNGLNIPEMAIASSSSPQSMYSYLGPQQENLPPPSSLAAEVSDMKNLLRSFFNEIVNLKRSQIPQTRPPFRQNYQSNRLIYQQN